MRFAASLYRRFEALVHELSKFGTVGAIGFVMNYGITNLLYVGLHWGPLTCNVVATAVTVTFAYFANRFWTFRHREQSGLGREYFLFFVFNGIGLLIQLLCVGFTYYTLKLTGPIAYNAALTVGVVGGTLFRYWSYKKWVFLPSSLPPVDPHTGLPEALPPPGSAQVEAKGVPLHPIEGISGGSAANGDNGRTGSRTSVSGGNRKNGSKPTTRAR